MSIEFETIICAVAGLILVVGSAPISRRIVEDERRDSSAAPRNSGPARVMVLAAGLALLAGAVISAM